jgi:Immunoglobulin-like domain of bacterial spore germination
MIRSRRLAAFALALALVAGAAAACGGGDSTDKVDAGGSTSTDSRSDSGSTTSDSRTGNDFIRVDAPTHGEEITSPVLVTGQNRTFENNVRIRIKGADGTTLADSFTTGDGEPGVWGRFAAPVRFDKGTNTSGTIVVFENSGETGAEVHVVEIPVKFA